MVRRSPALPSPQPGGESVWMVLAGGGGSCGLPKESHLSGPAESARECREALECGGLTPLFLPAETASLPGAPLRGHPAASIRADRIAQSALPSRRQSQSGVKPPQSKGWRHTARPFAMAGQRRAGHAAARDFTAGRDGRVHDRAGGLGMRWRATGTERRCASKRQTMKASIGVHARLAEQFGAGSKSPPDCR